MTREQELEALLREAMEDTAGAADWEIIAHQENKPACELLARIQKALNIE